MQSMQAPSPDGSGRGWKCVPSTNGILRRPTAALGSVHRLRRRLLACCVPNSLMASWPHGLSMVAAMQPACRSLTSATLKHLVIPHTAHRTTPPRPNNTTPPRSPETHLRLLSSHPTIGTQRTIQSRPQPHNHISHPRHSLYPLSCPSSSLCHPLPLPSSHIKP